MNRRPLYIAAAVVLTSLTLWFFLRDTSKTGQIELVKEVVKADFEVHVTTSGELQAKNSVKIMGPATLRNAGIWQVQIEHLIPEGTVVEAGQEVATLNRSELTGKIQEAELNFQKAQSQFTQTQLDSTLTLSQARDELVNQKFQLEEKKIAMEQSQFEAPSIQRQAELEYEKTRRAHEQAMKNYATKVKQAEAKVAESQTELTKQQNRLNEFRKILNDFVVMAPGKGMVIYTKNWDGTKIAAGSQINVWNPVVAELPDLSRMISKTYVNEIDIKKIASGQKVRIGLDADPAKKFTGTVTAVANIGEQRPNADAKVFEVLIEIDQADSLARPSMTTSNMILVSTVKDALSVPLEAVHPATKEGKNISYVFKKSGSGLIRQQVELGEMNDIAVVVLQGLEEKERVLLTFPPDTSGLKWNLVEAKLARQ
jgi:multidrug efflux pump subunit AcrA (membrane-fusion protein)